MTSMTKPRKWNTRLFKIHREKNNKMQSGVLFFNLMNYLTYSVIDQKNKKFSLLMAVWNPQIHWYKNFKFKSKLFKSNTSLTTWLKRKSGYCPFFNTYPVDFVWKTALFRKKIYFLATITSPEAVRPKTRFEVRKTVRVSMKHTGWQN